jgi:hypothetical protein
MFFKPERASFKLLNSNFIVNWCINFICFIFMYSQMFI